MNKSEEMTQVNDPLEPKIRIVDYPHHIGPPLTAEGRRRYQEVYAEFKRLADKLNIEVQLLSRATNDSKEGMK